MPSEAQEPRDRGPPPPVTRAGRSAQLAKTAASSPASERRPRGRPRKDGSNGRSAPPTPPPPPPPPNSRKKGRSRGRAQVEDEESTDAAEKRRPQRTEPRGSAVISTELKEVKEQKEVKATGCRRSASRKKLNTNPVPDPEPSHDMLSSKSELDSNLTVPSCSPEPPPCSEENRTSPAPAAPPTDHLPEEVHPLSPALDLKPDPDPSEEDRPSLSHSPALAESVCSPIRVTIETEGGGASPMEQSPVTSPHSSPPVSPCVRLEDDDSLSPLFQRSLSEDSGGSPTPRLDHTKRRLKQCAFCYRGDQPPLGQGRLLVFGPTPGYIPLHILNRRAASDWDDDCHDHCYRGNQAPPTCSSPEQCEDESSSEFIKQLGPIGLPRDINVQSLFDATGQCCAHLQCASWSEGVRQGEGQSLLFVDKAIDSGSTQVCAFCQQLGATVRCHETGCGQSYHFPCAAASGAHQDWSQRRTLCRRHAHTASSRCVSCSDSAGPGGLLMCCCCGNCYHGSCLDPPLSPSTLCRAGWQCPECRVCRSCRLRGDEAVLLVCERCDKAYHTHCLTPPVDHTPSSGWICRNCRVCRRCGVTSSGQWANHLFLCESCDPTLPCLLCGHTTDQSTLQEVLTCTCCYRSVHSECLKQVGEGRAGSEGYICSSCRPQGTELNPMSINHTSVPPTNISLLQVPTHSEAPLISSSAHNLVQLISSEPQQRQTNPSELQSSPIPSLAEHHRSPQPKEKQYSTGPLIEDLQIIPRQSTTVLKVSPAPLLKDLESSLPVSSPELQRSPGSSSKETNQCCSSSSNETHQIPPTVHTNLKCSFLQSLKAICQSHLPSTEEQHQSPAPCTEEQHQSLVLSTEEQHQSPVPSTEEQHQSPVPSTEEQRQSPVPSTEEQRQSPIPSIKEQYHIPAHSTEEQHQSTAPSTVEKHQSTAPSTEEQHQSTAPSTVEQHQNPVPYMVVQYESTAPSTEVQHQSIAPSTEVQHQSTAPSTEEQHQSPAPSTEEQHQSPVPFTEEQHQSTAPSTEEQHQSPVPSIEEQHQSPAPSTEEQHQSPVPFTEEQHQSTAPSIEEQHQSPAPSTEEQHQSIAPSTEKLHLSPAPSTEELHQSPAPSTEELHQSPSSSTEEQHQSPVPSTEEQHQSPAPSTEEQHQSTAPSTEEQHQSPVPTSEEQHQSPAPSTEEQHQSIAPSTEKLHQSIASSTEKLHQSPAPSTEELHQSPSSSTEEQHQSPSSSTEEQHQSPVPSTEEQHQSPAPSTEELHQSPAPSTEELHQSPAPSTEELHQSPSSSTEELHQSPVPSTEEQLQSPAPSTVELHQSPAPSTEERLQSPAPSTVELHQSPVPSTEELHQSPAPSTEELHQSPAPSTEYQHQSPAPSTEKQHQSPAPSTEEQHQSPAPSTEDQHQSPACSTEKQHQSPACSTEKQHQSPAPSTEDQHQSPACSTEYHHQSPATSTEDQHQSPVPFTEEQHQSPVPFTEELHQIVATPVEEQHHILAPSTEKQHQSPSSSTEEQHQSPEPSTEELHQSPASYTKEQHQSTAPSTEELLQSPVPSTGEQHQSPASYTEEQHQSTAPSTEEQHQSPVPSTGEQHQSPASYTEEQHQSTAPSTEEQHQSPVPSTEEQLQSPVPSTEEQHQSPAPSTDKQLQSPAPSTEEQHQSPAPSTEEQHQSPAPSTEEQHQSPAPSTEEQHQSPAPFTEEQHKSPAPFTEEQHKSPAPFTEEQHQSPALSTEDQHQSPAPSTEDQHQSPAPSTEDQHQSAAPSTEEVLQSSALSANETHQSSLQVLKIQEQCPKAICQSPAPSTEEFHQSLAASLQETHLSLVASLQEVLQSHALSPKETHESHEASLQISQQNSASSPKETHQTLEASLQETNLNLESSLQESCALFPKETNENLEESLQETQQSPTLSQKETHLCLEASLKETHLNMEVSLQETHQSPAVSLKVMHQSPEFSPKDLHQSPASFSKFHKSSASSVSSSKDIYQSPLASPKDVYQSLSLSPKDVHQSSASSSKNDHQGLVSSPKDIHLSAASSLKKTNLDSSVCQGQEVCTSSPEVTHQCQAPSSEETHQSWLQEVPAPFLVENYQRLTQSQNQSQAPVSDAVQQCPTSSKVETNHCQISEVCQEHFHQTPEPCPAHTNQSFTHSLKHSYQSPALSPEKTYLNPGPSVEDMLKEIPQSPALSPEKTCQSPILSIEVISSSPGLCNEELKKKHVQSCSEIIPSPLSPLKTLQDPALLSEWIKSSSGLSPTNTQEIPPLCLKEIHQKTLVSLAKPPDFHEGTDCPSPSPAELQDESSLPQLGQAEFGSGLQESLSSPHANSLEDQEQNTSLSHLCPENSTQSQSGPIEPKLGQKASPCPAEQHQSPSRIPAQNQSSSCQLSFTSYNPAQNPSEDQQSPLQTAHSPPSESLTKLDLSPTRSQSEPAESKNSLERKIRLSRSCSPTLPLIPTQEAIGSDPAQDIPVPDPELTQAYSKSSSAPCSPNTPPFRPRLCSLSQLSSPVQLQCDQPIRPSDITTEPSPQSDGQALKSSSDHPQTWTPESLDHSSLIYLPCVKDTKVGHSPCGGPSPCPETVEAAGDDCTQPAFGFCPMPFENNPPKQSASPRTVTQPEPTSCRNEEMGVHPDSPIHKEAISGSGLSFSQISHTHAQGFCSPPSNPSHSSLTHPDPADALGTHNLSQISSIDDGQMSLCSVSPLRSSLASQASSVQTLSPATHSSPHTQAGETQKTPHLHTQNTGTKTGLTGTQWSSALDSDVVLFASPIIQSTVSPLRSAEHESPSAVSPISAGPESDGSLSSSHRRPETPAQTSPSHVSLVPSSPTQDDVSNPRSALTSNSYASSLSSTHSQVGPCHEVCTSSPVPISTMQLQSSPVSASPVQSESKLDTHPVSPVQQKPCPDSVKPEKPELSPDFDLALVSQPKLVLSLDPVPVIPIQPDSGSGPGPDCASFSPCEVSPKRNLVSPVPATLGEADVSSSPCPTNPLQPGSGFGQQMDTNLEIRAAGDVSPPEEPRRNKEKEEEDRGGPLLPRAVPENPGDEEEPVHQVEGEGNHLRTVPVCSPSGVQQSVAILAPSPASPTLQPSCSSLHLPPSPPPQASSPEPPPSSSPHKAALPTYSPQAPPPSEGHPQEDEEARLEYSQSQSLIEPIAMPTEPTKDGHQSHVEPSEKQEEVAEQQPMREKQEVEEEVNQSDAEEEPPVSPVLDLDPSLDEEVMDLMSSATTPSLLHLSSPSPPLFFRRGKGRSFRPPPFSSRPLDDLSIRLRQSPFSTEASPETSPARTPITPPPLTPPSRPPSRESPPLSQALPTTVFSLTRKIGMGKPAISKRKFSPGRARVRQGSWWSSRRVLSPPSSSQDSMGEGGWDSPKPRPPDSPLWSMKVGRGSGFPGRRRSRGGGVGGGRGGRGRSRLKTHDSLTVVPGGGYVEVFQLKEEEENSMHNTVVMFSTSDHFTLKQDMCVVCGSFGHGAEGRLLACSQCGQCYHPYCVNVKVTRVVLTKGWRCLECTVCEACGDASDPGRLLLCDDCDISYHTYCLDPPLHTVPKGAWKCQWCVWCVQCGSASPGLRCDWQSNYSLCGPCCSLSQCPVCLRRYAQDELILQCQQCDRWVHAVCQGLTSEEEVELAADEGFDCSLCRTHGRSSYGRSEGLVPYMAQIMSRNREPDSRTFTQDGVCLTESGLTHLQALVEPLTSPRRYRRCKPKLKLRIINQNSVSVLQTTPDPETPTEPDQNRGDLDCDMKSDSSPERDSTHLDDITKDTEATDSNKKKKRKPYRPGIGGFMVRQRGGKAGLSRKDSTEILLSRDPGVLDADVSMETVSSADQVLEKVKKRYRKKKTKLEEAFPSYLQEAFFGRDLLNRSRHVEEKVGAGGRQATTPGYNQSASGDMKGPAHRLHGPSPSEQTVGTMATNRKQGALPVSEETLMDLSDVLNTDPHILATGHTGEFQVERSPSPFAGLDISSLSSEPAEGCGRGQKTAQEEPLDAILSPELDKMVTDGAILSRLFKIPELEGKDVEEVFTAVLSPNSSTNQPDPSKRHSSAAAFPHLPLMNGLMPAAPHLPNTPAVSSAAPAPARFRVLPPQSPAPCLASTNQMSAATEGEQDALSTAQKSMLKWEKEESLGELATVAPVLYCNTNFPQLRQQYPDWPTRVKQITKLWRKASSLDRAPYVQKARDNRAAQRINKVQLSNDPLKRLQPVQQQQQQQQQQQATPPPTPQQQGPYEHISMETEMSLKDPLRPRESEQEQEWKLRQQMRQKSKQLAKMEATQKLEQVKNEQRQQQLRLTGHLSPEATAHQSVTGDNASPQHQPSSRQHLLQQGNSGSANEVFLRPQVPPLSGFSSLPTSPLHQPPSSPQVFSPPSSRPTSPWDPYSKGAGTPRPSSAQSGGAPQQQRLASLNASPAHDSVGSPAPSPDSKTCDASQSGSQQSRTGMISPSSGSAPDLSVRLVGLRAAESQQRMNQQMVVPGSPGGGSEFIQGVVFKAPMPPQQEAGGGRRELIRPTDLGFSLPQVLEPSFPSSPLSSLGSPHCSPYAQTPGTPRPDYSQQTGDLLPQQSPLSSRPSPDPYSNPQTPGTPRPHSDSAYLTTTPALRPDQFSQQPAGQRPSPSHPPPDPYASNPGTPHPLERFPRSPGTQRCADLYAQPAGTPRPSPDPYLQQPSTPWPQKAQADGFPTQPAASGSSPLTSGPSAELQQSQGRPQQDPFPRTNSSQTPKHPGISEEASLSLHSVGQDASHMTPGLSQTDKTAVSGMSAVGVSSLDGPMSVLPQLGDSEEKLRQRQWLRQRILRQQHQKSALRQEKGLQDPVSGPAHSWLPEDPLTSSTAPSDLFGRPPPPYPGTVRPPGPRFPGVFPGEQQRGLSPEKAPFPRQNISQNLGLRGLAIRFGGPNGAPTGFQDSSLHPPQGPLPAPGLSSVEGNPVQMRRPMPSEFTRIRSVVPPNAHMMPGVPQPIPPRSLLVQQHSVMPFIELRHRAPENRLRLPFPLPTCPDPEIPLLRPRDPAQPAAVPPGLARMGEAVMAQQDQHHLGHSAVLTQSSEAVHPGHDGIEEHLEGEDSAVKDLEDVEVKDLVDLNLNLDPEDGKEDLDLGPNDLHLDDFLLSGKFDLIAYADPELNLEDKKDMFNEDLDLGEPVEDKEGSGSCRKTDGHTYQVKQEVKEAVKREGVSGLSTPPPVALSRPPGALGPEAAGPSVLVLKEKLEGSGSVSGAGSARQVQDQVMTTMVHPSLSAGQQTIFQQNQRQLGPVLSPHPQVSASQGPPALSVTVSLQPPQPRLLLNTQKQPPHPEASAQNQNKCRPLLLMEQPLLIQDLLDKERQEQQQQKHMQAMIRQTSGPESGFSNMDFDSISDPIMKAKMVALKGINKVMSQGNLGLNPVVINRFQQDPGVPGPEGIPQPSQPPHLVVQDGKVNPQLVRRNPPSFGSGFVNESQRRQYEEWLGETQQLLQMQQRLLEDQITAHRKAKKALSAKQRTAKRAGRAFAEEDAAQLRYIGEQQGAVQKQLEQIRKQQKDHTELIEDYKNKNQQRLLQMPSQNPRSLTQPLVPLQPQQNGPPPVRAPNVPVGWTLGSGAPGSMGQRIPSHLPPKIPTTLPNNPQGLQNPQSMVSGFTADPRGPSGGPNGVTGDGAAVTPQVKFDDNNPFSEGFQERERRERLREQQERQRVQLMQEVERHRSLQQRLELKQQDLMGTAISPGAGAGAVSGSRVTQTPGPGGLGPVELVRSSLRGDGLSRMPFFSSDSGMDFLQSSTASRPSPQVQTPAGAAFSSHAGLHQGLTGGPLYSTPGLFPGDGSGSPLQTRLRLPAQVHPAAAGMTPAHPGGQGPQFGNNSNSSSPSTPLPPSFPCSSSGGSASTIHLHADKIAEDKPKKKSRRGDGTDAGGEGTQMSLSPHSDITAPPTPAVSDTSCSTPTHQSDSSFTGLTSSTELERQLSARSSLLVSGGQRVPLSALQMEVKEERIEAGPCGGGVMKMEEAQGYRFSSPSSPLQGGDGSKELLRHLLKDKTSPANMASPTRQTPLTPHLQLSTDSVRSKEEEGTGCHGNVLIMRDSPGLDRKKTQRCKRPNRPDKDKAPPKTKKKKREEEEEEEKSLHSSSDTLMTHLRQLSVLPLMEPVLGVDLSLFPPYGSSSLGKDSRLSGSFGNASLDRVSDYYSQLIYKQSNLSNPPTPPASLPPTPPPVARQKLLNGFATTEELTRKEISEQEGVSALKQKEDELLNLNHAPKTVHVPASLPTPPHNNQEELRVQNSLDHDSLDGYVPSSSPESVADMEVSRYPDLSFIKLEQPSPCPSPTFPIIPCAWGKGSAVKQEVKAEPHLQGHPSCSNKDLVTITITLNPVTAQNVPGVMAAMAGLLRVPGPVNYQLSRVPGPEQNSLALLAGVRVPVVQGPEPGRPQRAPPAVGNQPRCCSRCKGLLGNGVHLKQEQESRTGSSLVFCSPNCSALYRSELQNSSAGSKSTVPGLLTGSERAPPSRIQHQYTNNMSSIAVHSLPHTPFSSSSSPPLTFPPASAITMETRPRTDSLKVKVKLKPRPRAVPDGDESPSSQHGKRMKSSRWKRWSVSISLNRGLCVPNEAVAMPTEEEVDELLKKLGVCLRPDPLPKDQRRCCFCHQQGDGLTDGPARLLNLDLDLWVHLNCALWSSEVYETQAGALINVELALRRGLTLRCVHCQQTGATTGCNRLRCTNTYHFTCALQAHCTFFKDKTMLCHLHKPRTLLLSGDRSSSCSPSSTPDLTSEPAPFSDPYDSELRCFAVFRRVFVQRDEARQIAAVVQRGERQHTFRVGSLLFRAIGRLLPHQMGSFHNQSAIFPVGYHANRYYWSMRHSNRRCKYMCYIEEEEAQPLFKVKVVEKGHEDLVLTGNTPKAVWDQVLDPVAQLRNSSGTLKLFPVYLKGEDLFGLTTSAVTRIIESLPGVEACERYTFRYGRNPLMEWPLAFNPSGSARSEPKACQAKRPYLLTSTAPRCQGSVGSIVGLVPGVLSLSPGESVAGAHQGRHSKSAQYRRMKAEWKSNVYLARSRIQGLGLYAARDIEKCTMVIEYIGAIIRSEVANRKERLYESQNRGVYMFRIDNDFVIDATITGGPARYINHSCAPNCITEVVTVEKENKIIISSCRRIQRGEELCYDYKFDLEDDQHKIPCHCGAVNCRKWMN